MAMNLSTLIKHSSHLLKIVTKSNNPADSIIQKYLREKKFIGSKERRFITELTYTSLRSLLLVQYLYKKIIADMDYKQVVKEQEESLFLFSLLGLIISDLISPERNSFKFSLLYDKILKNSNEFHKELSDIILDNFTFAQPDVFINKIIAEFENLNKLVNTIIKSNTQPSEMDFECLSYRYSIPPLILKSLYHNGYYKKNLELISETANYLMSSAKLNLRVNTLKSDRNKVLESLRKADIDAQPTQYSPDGIIINQRLNLYELSEFKSGLLEIQDEGSQLISLSLAPDEKSDILDACTGAGGKALHLASITKNNSKIISVDINQHKLFELQKRAKRADAKSIQAIHYKMFARLQSSRQKMLFDYVLIDAPCSGTGTVRRSPWLKYHITAKTILKRQKNQLEILEYYSKFVKENGVLLYSTCSLLPEENEIVIDKFLEKHTEFSPDPIYPHLMKFGIEIPYLNKNDFMMSILPSILNCDGFFVARMKKTLHNC